MKILQECPVAKSDVSDAITNIILSQEGTAKNQKQYNTTKTGNGKCLLFILSYSFIDINIDLGNENNE